MSQNKIPTTKDESLIERAELVSFDQRLTNIEKITSTIDHVADKALESWSHYLAQKNESEKREIETHNIQHKRASQILLISIVLVFSLLMVSIFKEQYDLVKMILGSSLALAAGAGLSTVFKTRKDT
jgi:hypothetical protein